MQMCWTATTEARDHRAHRGASMLSAVRGEVIHNGFLRIKDRRDLRSWYDFACHLHDLCKRIIMREINYGGSYQASTNAWSGNYSWIE